MGSPQLLQNSAAAIFIVWHFKHFLGFNESRYWRALFLSFSSFSCCCLCFSFSPSVRLIWSWRKAKEHCIQSLTLLIWHKPQVLQIRWLRSWRYSQVWRKHSDVPIVTPEWNQVWIEKAGDACSHVMFCGAHIKQFALRARDTGLMGCLGHDNWNL